MRKLIAAMAVAAGMAVPATAVAMVRNSVVVQGKLCLHNYFV